MIYMIQILKMLNKEQRQLFVDLFDDISFEVEECGYEGDEAYLVNQMMDDHLGIFMEDESQLQWLTDYILENQGKLESKVRGAELCMNLR